MSSLVTAISWTEILVKLVASRNHVIVSVTTRCLHKFSLRKWLRAGKPSRWRCRRLLFLVRVS